MKIKLFQPSVIINEPRLQTEEAASVVNAPRRAPGGSTNFENYGTANDHLPGGLLEYLRETAEAEADAQFQAELEAAEAAANEGGSPPADLNLVDYSAQQLPVMTGGQSGPAPDQLPGGSQEIPADVLEAQLQTQINQDELFEDLLTRFREGDYVTSDEINELINSNSLSREDVETLIGQHSFTEEQFASLFSQGLLTREEIENLISTTQEPIQEEQNALSARLDELLELGLTRDEAIAQLSEELIYLLMMF